MRAHTLRAGPIGAGRQMLAAALLLAMLAACGGGGGSPTAMTPVDPGGGNGGGMPDPGPGGGTAMPGPDNGNGGGMPPASGPMTASTGAMVNTEAADLADHWHIHRGTGALKNSLGLSPASDHAAAQDSYAVIAKLAEIDTPPVMQVQGERGGITVGRFTGGPADQLEITLDYDCSPGCYSAFPAEGRPLLARAAKLWSHHVEGTLPAYAIDAGDPRAIELNRGPLPAGTTSTTTHGVHIFVEQIDPASGAAGMSAIYSVQVGNDYFRGRTGMIRIGSRYLDFQQSTDRGGAAYAAGHEIGHVLTQPLPAAYYEPEHGYSPPGLPQQLVRGPHRRYIDFASGTWTGPAVSRTPGGERPAAFENNGLDISHWAEEAGTSTVNHHAGSGWLEGPQALDVAYLEDLGYAVAPDAVADAAELYSYGAWAEDSGISIAVSRDLNTYFDDTLHATATAFGRPPARTFADAHTGMTGTASWMGVLLGVDLQSEGLPPVTGETTLSVALADLTGTARFSGLEALARGARADFRQTSLAYDFTVDGNTFGNGREPAQGQIEGNWYGDSHDEVAGTVHDTRAGIGLLGAFIGER